MPPLTWLHMKTRWDPTVPFLYDSDAAQALSLSLCCLWCPFFDAFFVFKLKKIFKVINRECTSKTLDFFPRTNYINPSLYATINQEMEITKPLSDAGLKMFSFPVTHGSDFRLKPDIISERKPAIRIWVNYFSVWHYIKLILFFMRKNYPDSIFKLFNL